MSFQQEAPTVSKKRGRRNADVESSSASTTTVAVDPLPIATTVASATGGLATRDFNFIASTPASSTPSTKSTPISNSVPKHCKLKSSSKSKEDMLSSLGLLPAATKIKVKPCDPTAGLTLGGVPVTPEKLANLTPMDLDEHVLMRNGEPLPIDELAELLGMEDDYDAIDDTTYGLDGNQQEDELILGMIGNGMLDLFLQNMDVGDVTS